MKTEHSKWEKAKKNYSKRWEKNPWKSHHIIYSIYIIKCFQRTLLAYDHLFWVKHQTILVHSTPKGILYVEYSCCNHRQKFHIETICECSTKCAEIVRRRTGNGNFENWTNDFWYTKTEENIRSIQQKRVGNVSLKLNNHK